MSQPSGWRVRISPGVDEAILAAAHGGVSARLARDLDHALDHLTRSGTRAPGVKKLKGHELWEVRVGDHRAYLCLVPGTNLIAVGVVLAKRTRRHHTDQLGTIERKVHRWRDRLAEEES